VNGIPGFQELKAEGIATPLCRHTPAIKTHPKGCTAFQIANTSIVLIYSLLRIQKDIILKQGTPLYYDLHVRQFILGIRCLDVLDRGLSAEIRLFGLIENY
jgi:hypothetical protein